ncbi:MAG: hypothetical protein IH592_11480 [Bacteroidales bacterium]|nr:hypothetical protein [Bacteroidales bacterium]
MKTKTILLACLLSGIGLTQISAQNSRDVYNWPVPESVVILDVYCGGQIIDQVQNTVPYTLKCRDKYKNGELSDYNQHLNNIQFVSLMTGELFKLQGHEKGTWNGSVFIGEVTGNLIGNQGHHYITREVYALDPFSWEITTLERRAVCH